MADERCVVWEPVAGIKSPCADISLEYRGPDRLRVVMHFSRVRGNPELDLELRFRGAIAYRWESESFGLLPVPPAPRLEHPEWSRWTAPLLRVEGSGWLHEHQSRNPFAAEDRAHFVLIAMNDVVELLAFPDVEAAWIPAAPGP